MKKAILLVATLAVGSGGTVFAHESLSKSPSAAEAPCMPPKVPQLWSESEDEIRTRMACFQKRLDALETQSGLDNLDTLTKKIAAQNEIEDMFIKFRQAQQAKFAPFQALAGAVVGSLITLLGVLINRKKTK